MYSDILRYIKTVDQVEYLTYEIDTLLASLYETQNQTLEVALKSVSIRTSQIIQKTFIKNNGSYNNRDIEDFLIGLRDRLKKLKVLKLSLAFEPSEDSIDNLFDWVLKNLGVGIILDIQKDKTILGGAIITFEGKYKDLSLRKILEEAFENKKEEILKTLE